MTNSPTHEKIARRAEEIWHRRGCPSGSDIAIWLEAEHQLTVDSPEPRTSGPAAGQPASGQLPGGETPATSPDALAANATLQKSAARAPQQRHGKNALPPSPPPSGKPLWNQPHSS